MFRETKNELLVCMTEHPKHDVHNVLVLKTNSEITSLGCVTVSTRCIR